MKNGKAKRFAHRAMSMLLAVLMVMPAGILAARAAGPSTTQTKLVVWDWIDDMQSIGQGADYNPANENKNIPVGETKYSRIMFYQNVGGDRYFFNAAPRGGTSDGYFSNYEEDKIYVDVNARVGNSVHKEWNSDMIAAEFGGSFLSTSGLRTPYIQWREVKEGYQSWRLWAANTNDTWSEYAVMQVDDYEDLDVRRTDGFDINAVSYYGEKNTPIRADGWIIAKEFVGAAAANHKFSFNYFTIWHWDNDAGGYNEAMDFDVGDRKFKTFNAGRNDGVEQFHIFLGKEYKVSTLAEDFKVAADQQGQDHHRRAARDARHRRRAAQRWRDHRQAGRAAHAQGRRKDLPADQVRQRLRQDLQHRRYHHRHGVGALRRREQRRAHHGRRRGELRRPLRRVYPVG